MEKEQKLLCDKALDAVRISEQRNIPKFVGFLSSAESAIINSLVKSANAVFFGGADDCERTVFGVLPDYIEQKQAAFPIDVITFNYPASYTLSHRDVLGAVMSAGVKRSGVGDIIITEGKAYVFVLSELSEFICLQVQKIKNVGVKATVTPAHSAKIELYKNKTEPFSFTVASNRLDAVLTGLINKSRSQCEALINDGFVSLNSFQVLKPIKKVEQGNTVTVRGFGKFKIVQLGHITKKGRQVITAEKYI